MLCALSTYAIKIRDGKLHVYEDQLGDLNICYHFSPVLLNEMVPNFETYFYLPPLQVNCVTF